MFERNWVLVYASASQGNQVLQFFESLRPKFTFLECERHQNISYMDRSDDL